MGILSSPNQANKSSACEGPMPLSTWSRPGSDFGVVDGKPTREVGPDSQMACQLSHVPRVQPREWILYKSR